MTTFYIGSILHFSIIYPTNYNQANHDDLKLTAEGAVLKLLVPLIIILANASTAVGLVGLQMPSKDFSELVGHSFRISAVEVIGFPHFENKITTVMNSQRLYTAVILNSF